MFLHDKCAHRRTSFSSLFVFLSLGYQTYQTWTLFLHSVSNLALCLQFSVHRHDIPLYSENTAVTASRKQIIHQSCMETVPTSAAESICLWSVVVLWWQSQCRVVKGDSNTWEDKDCNNWLFWWSIGFSLCFHSLINCLVIWYIPYWKIPTAVPQSLGYSVYSLYRTQEGWRK